jgi:hypothetical protein
VQRAAVALLVCVAGLLAALPPASAQDDPPPPPPAEEPATEQEPRGDKPRAPHPEPRIIVDVARVKGPHDKKAVERSARMGWGRIVRCYNFSKADGVLGKGSIEARVTISADGQVRDARRRGGTVKGELARCVVRSMRRLPMPRARAGSTADIVIQVAPGD